MALEYQLSYTAEDIDNRLGTVNENADTLSKVVKDLNTANTDIADLILNKVSKTTTVNGKTLDTNITLTAGDVLADPQGSAASALEQAKTYTDSQVSAEKTNRENGDTNTLDAAKEYTNEKIAAEAEARATQLTNAISDVKIYISEEDGKEAVERDNAIANHNISEVAHNDIRKALSDLSERINTLLDSDDTTLDQRSEVVNYIKNNKTLIDGITTNKVNVSDIIDNLATKDAKKPLSANQGAILKELIDVLQTEINGKSDKNHTHNYAGSASVGGSAKSAVKLDTSAGSVTKPVYFYDGKPVEINYSIQSNVPSDAKFTDTTYSNMTAATSTTAGKGGLVPAPAAGKQASFLRGDGTWVVPDNTTYNTATTASEGLMSSADKIKLDAITASADSVSFTRSLTSGTKVGTITINGENTELYAPSKPSISVSSSKLVITT